MHYLHSQNALAEDSQSIFAKSLLLPGAKTATYVILQFVSHIAWSFKPILE
jgi:hypothetical protein